MEQDLKEAIKSTKESITSALIKRAIQYGCREDEELNPFMYAGCIVAAAVSAWARMMVCIKFTDGEAVEPKEIERLIRELCDAAIKDTMGSIDSFQESIKTK